MIGVDKIYKAFLEMRYRFHLLVLFVLMFTISGTTQNQKSLDKEAEKTEIIEQRLQLLAEQLENNNIDFTTLMDVLSSYYENPINLNGKDIKEELLELKLLSEFQVNNLVEHIKKNGKLMSIYELQSVEGFDIPTILAITPFVTVNSEFYSPHTSFKEMMDNAKNTIFLRYTRILENQKGYNPISDDDWANSPNSHYLGSKDKYYMRYRFKYLNNVSIGFTAEKDAGESFLGNKRAEQLFNIPQNKGFDFYSAHFYIKNVGKIKGLAIGDYHMQLGQGLTFWTGLAFGKMVNVMSFKRNARGIKPYASVDENNFLRGAAITYKLHKNVDITAFGSRKKIDANIATITDSSNQNIDGVSTFTSFQSTGNHNTVGSLTDRHSLEENYAGTNLKFHNNNLSIGLTGVYSYFGGEIKRTLKPYSQFQFNTNQNMVVGADYSYLYKNFNLYGEVSRSQNGGTAQLHGLLASLDPKLSASILYRNYGKDYQSLRSNALAENSTNVNEKGLLFGLEARPNRFWIIDAYLDQYKFPWLRYQTDQPNTRGLDALAQVKYKPSKKLEMYVRIRNRIKSKNQPNVTNGIPKVENASSWYYRYHVAYKVTETIQLKNRVVFRTYKQGTQAEEYGYLVYQDIVYKPLSGALSFTFRYALFDTDYNTRIYAYENNVLYAYSIPAYFNRGTRTQLTVRYRIKKGIDLWLRWAQWHYNNVETIGSGLDEIQGKNKTEVKAQLRFVF